jgi:hypothetical protein
VKVKYDVSGVEVQGDFKPVQPGLYRAKVEEINEWSGQYGAGAEVVLSVTARSDGTKKDLEGLGSKLWTYIYFDHEPTAFKWAEFLASVGAPPKGTFDSAKIAGKVEVLVRVKGDKDRDTDEYRPKVAKLLPLPEDAEEPEDEPDEPEAEAEAEPEEEAVDLDALDRDELKKLIKEEQLGTLAELGITKATTDDEIREIIAEKLGGEEEEPEAEDEPEEEEPEPEEEEEPEAEPEPEDDGLDELDRDALKKLIKTEDLGSLADLGINKATSDDEIREKIREKRGGGEKPDYSTWTAQQLKDEIKERGLTIEGRYSGAKAIKALQEDDSSDSDPF